MQFDTEFPAHCHDLSALPLFGFQHVVVAPPATRAGLHLTRRYRVHPAIADVVAELAGLGERGAR